MTTTFAQAWEGLTAGQRSSLADGCADEASSNGLYVWRDATQTRQAIPPVLSPVILEDDHRDRLSTGAHHLLSAIRKSSEALITGQLHLFDRRRIFAALSPLERECLQTGFPNARNIAIARADLFPAIGGGHSALEMNATIPAMPGYADAVAHAWIRSVGSVGGLDEARISGLIEAQGSNAGDLLLITADHGNDPTYRGSDHTRERVPQLGLLQGATAGIALGDRATFADLGRTILDALGVAAQPEALGTSFWSTIAEAP